MIIYKEQAELTAAENELLAEKIRNLIIEYEEKTGLKCEIEFKNERILTKCDDNYITYPVIKVIAIIR